MRTANNIHCGTHFSLHGDDAQKPPVVFIHGVGLDATMWRAMVAMFTADFTPLTYDLLGHGHSHNPAGARTVTDFTVQLRDLADRLNLQRLAVVGFSLGALIAQDFAVANPHRVTHLALLHSVHQRTVTQHQAVQKRYRLAQTRGTEVTVDAAIARWFSPTAQDGADARAVREMFARHHGDGYLKAYRLFANPEPSDPTTIRCQTVIITGEDDHGSTPEMSRALANTIPNATVIVNPNHRHMAPMEHPNTIATQIRSLLSDGANDRHP